MSGVTFRLDLANDVGGVERDPVVVRLNVQ